MILHSLVFVAPVMPPYGTDTPGLVKENKALTYKHIVGMHRLYWMFTWYQTHLLPLVAEMVR